MGLLNMLNDADITLKSFFELLIHALVAAFIVGMVYHSFTVYAAEIDEIHKRQVDQGEKIHRLFRKVERVELINKRLKRIEKKIDSNHKMIVEEIRTDN